MKWLQSFILFLLLSFFISIPTIYAQSPWPASAKLRAQELVAQMTQAEKLSLMMGSEEGSFAGTLPAIPRLGIPEFTLLDSPQGVGDGFTHVTAFPCALVAASSWDIDLLESFGDAMGNEQFQKGTNIMLGPGTNIARVPFNGRLYEYYSEEPFLSSAVVAAVVRGIQTKNNISATVKHFCANNQEFDRGGEDAQIGERVLHELYLPSYLAASNAGAGAFMLGVNKIRGLENSANPETIGYLFDSGFQGFLMTDWAGIVIPNASAAVFAGTSVEMPKGIQYQYLPDFIANGSIPISVIDGLVIRVLTTAAALGILDTPSDPSRNPNTVVMTPDHVTLARTLAARGTVLLKNNIPLGDTLPLLPIIPSRFPRGILVLGDQTTVAGCGSGEVQRPYVITPIDGLYNALAPNATRPVNCTIYTDLDFFQDGAACKTVSGVYPTDAITQCCELCTNTSSCNAWTVVPNGVCPGQPMPMPANQCFLKPDTSGRTSHPGITSGTCAPLPPSSPPTIGYTGQDPETAAALARTVDLVIFVAAAPSVEPNPGCEGNDRTTLALPDWNNNVIEAVVAANANIIVVTRTQGAVLMPWIDAVPAILHQGLAGQEAGNALADILLGKENPGGKLTVSFPANDFATWLTTPDQYPGILNNNTGFYETNYSEGLLIGYRYYDKNPDTTQPLFAFGHGLSYSTFSFSNLHVVGVVSPTSNATVSVTVTNTAGPSGRDVIQLYVSGAGFIGDPVRQLKGFSPTGLLTPNDSITISFSLSIYHLRFFDEETNKWMTYTPGNYNLWIGASSKDLRLESLVTVSS
jgi:beta-glucosidase